MDYKDMIVFMIVGFVVLPIILIFVPTDNWHDEDRPGHKK
jgi:hypothetical protein